MSVHHTVHYGHALVAASHEIGFVLQVNTVAKRVIG